MIKARINQLDKKTALAFMGCKKAAPDDILTKTDECLELVQKSAVPGLIYRIADISQIHIPELNVLNYDSSSALLTLSGKDMARLLSGCKQAVLMAATVGAGIDRIIMAAEAKDMAEALITDACAGAAIENVCDNFEADLRAELESSGLSLTRRFSPGYGDLPLSTQKQLCAVLDTARKIGLTLTENNIMIPRKSVTAVLGIYDGGA